MSKQPGKTPWSEVALADAGEQADANWVEESVPSETNVVKSLGYNPFKQSAPPAPIQEPEKLPVPENTPEWVDFVNFIRKYGKDISQARYPNPRGEVVDTIWKGIQVFNYPRAEIRHLVHGWMSFEDANG